MTYTIVRLHLNEHSERSAPASDGRPQYQAEGPLEERRSVETAWGEAWAEIGCYVAHDDETGFDFIIAPSDWHTGYYVLS